MASVQDVAAYILSKEHPMSTMKLQKLCYYSQAWSLVWDETPLFLEPIQAWANGPVVYELFKNHRRMYSVSSWPHGSADRLTMDERETIDAVYQGYGKLTGRQLSELTHKERPWIEARAGLPEGARSTATIAPDTMQDFFGGLSASRRH